MELPTYLNIEADDVWDEDLYQHFEKTCEFIHAALSRKENVLVHCMAGVSRSASVVIAYLIKHTGRRFSEALEYTRSNRRSTIYQILHRLHDQATYKYVKQVVSLAMITVSSRRF